MQNLTAHALFCSPPILASSVMTRTCAMTRLPRRLRQWTIEAPRPPVVALCYKCQHQAILWLGAFVRARPSHRR